MRKLLTIVFAFVIYASFATISTAQYFDDNVPEGFHHGLQIKLNGTTYYLAGPADGPDGAKDIPGHYWMQLDDNTLLGLHYNTGPYDAPQWWSSDSKPGELLYVVVAEIDEWSFEKAQFYAEKGLIHYHELVSVDKGLYHPNMVVWMRHQTKKTFTLDGGPHPEYSHPVTSGVDWLFIPKYFKPYLAGPPAVTK